MYWINICILRINKQNKYTETITIFHELMQNYINTLKNRRIKNPVCVYFNDWNGRLLLMLTVVFQNMSY